MNQHDEQHGHEQGDAPVDGAQPGPAEHGGREEQPDLAEHESTVPSSTEDDPRAERPDVAEHEAAVPSSGHDIPSESTEQAATGATVPGPVDKGEQSATAIPSTGDDRVDEALSRLGDLDRLDVTEHAGVVEDVHRALQDTLAEEED